ncbi:glycosyltransferase family 4 protein [Galbibacter sp. EGI 63066]|uniref:glycosyltransferase family 4 protein n=1 Tax=Galbibacter sp. EGI 63066 TaxID=2993559 RepID=UPI00224908E6|nr:glycosyltransferase family 4 protein [Galbibacter sp. EGI 63066]MCX2679168.1 glycosyltransferase family 4 protein [Galbibacter sp. EGI 63066]
MKILFLIDQVYLHGGIERVLSIKANYLSKHKHGDIYITTTSQKGKAPCYEFHKDITFYDLNIDYNRNKSYFHPSNLLKIPKHIRRLKKAIRTITPDIIVVCSHSTDTYFVPFIHKRIPKIKEFHYSKILDERKKKKEKNSIKGLFLKFAEYVEKQYDHLIVLNRDELQYYTSDNTVVIPNPLTFFPEGKASLTNKIAITAGRIAPVKGYDTLIDIWKLVYQEHPDWVLQIYGTGEQVYMGYLKDKIEDEKLEDAVKLCGTTNQISNKMLESSLYLMSSHNECFPLVLLEAQSCGLPIVSFDCPHGPRNIIEENTGCLVTPMDIDKYAHQVKKLMSDHSKRVFLGIHARNNAKNYTEDKVMVMWIRLFEKTIAEKQ